MELNFNVVKLTITLKKTTFAPDHCIIHTNQQKLLLQVQILSKKLLCEYLMSQVFKHSLL